MSSSRLAVTTFVPNPFPGVAEASVAAVPRPGPVEPVLALLGATVPRPPRLRGFRPPRYDVANFHRIVVHGSNFRLEWLRFTVSPDTNYAPSSNAQLQRIRPVHSAAHDPVVLIDSKRVAGEHLSVLPSSRPVLTRPPTC